MNVNGHRGSLPHEPLDLFQACSLLASCVVAIGIIALHPLRTGNLEIHRGAFADLNFNQRRNCMYDTIGSAAGKMAATQAVERNGDRDPRESEIILSQIGAIVGHISIMVYRAEGCADRLLGSRPDEAGKTASASSPSHLAATLQNIGSDLSALHGRLSAAIERIERFV